MPHSVYHRAITLMSRVWCLAAPASVNFGEVCVQSVNEHKVNVINNLDWFIHFVLKVRLSHDSVLMLPFSCSHRPGVCITRPNCKARSDKIWDKGLAVFHILTALNYLSTLYIATSVLQWAGWAIWKPGWANERIFRRAANVCPPWPGTLPAPMWWLTQV